jgi:DivIVA domain-containing protein
MELERRNIERQDFPSARRGYDSDAVDRHLSAIADAVEQLKAAVPTQGTVAGVTAQRVEAIVAAAEASAREIEERANADAAQIRERAEASAAAHVRRAESIAEEMAGRAAELQQQISLLIEQIAAMNAGVRSVGLAEREPVAELEQVAEPQPELVTEPVAEPQSELVTETEPVPEPEPEPVPATAVEQSAPAPEGARLIALNMALSGTPREETARYLRDNYDLANEESLLDDVYAKAGG